MVEYYRKPQARDSAELRRLCSERDQLREKVAEQAREIAVLKANVVTDNSMVLVNALAELERLKAQPSAAVPDSVVWIDAHHIQPGNNPSFIRDVALVSAVKTTETQVPLVRLNQPASAGDERAVFIRDFKLKGRVYYDANTHQWLPTRDSVEGFTLAQRVTACWAGWTARAALSAPSHGEQVRPMVPGGWSVERGCSPSGYVLHSPGGSMIRVCDSGMGGIETAFAMFLKAMLAASPSAGSQEQGE